MRGFRSLLARHLERCGFNPPSTETRKPPNVVPTLTPPGHQRFATYAVGVTS